jgi:hypothetical protein
VVASHVKDKVIHELDIRGQEWNKRGKEGRREEMSGIVMHRRESNGRGMAMRGVGREEGNVDGQNRIALVA